MLYVITPDMAKLTKLILESLQSNVFDNNSAEHQ